MGFETFQTLGQCYGCVLLLSMVKIIIKRKWILLRKSYRVNHNTNSYFPDHELCPFNISKHSSREIHFLPKRKFISMLCTKQVGSCYSWTLVYQQVKNSHEIKRRLLLGRKAITNLDNILKSRDITLPTKVHLVKAMVFPVVMYGCESWTIKKAEHRRIDAFELWC